MSIFETLTKDMQKALKAGDKDRLSTIRLLRGQIKDAAIEKRSDLTPDEEIKILFSAAKKRQESIEIYTKAGRSDLAEKEQKELDVINSYLPTQLSPEEINAMVDKAIAATNAQTLKDLGKVMAVVMSETKGRADGKIVSEMVRQKLS